MGYMHDSEAREIRGCAGEILGELVNVGSIKIQVKLLTDLWESVSGTHRGQQKKCGQEEGMQGYPTDLQPIVFQFILQSLLITSFILAINSYEAQLCAK